MNAPHETPPPAASSDAPPPAASGAAAVRLQANPFEGDRSPTLSNVARVFWCHHSPRLLGTAAIVAIVARLAVGGWDMEDTIIPLVLVAVWPVQEWLIHVFILHFRPREVLGRKVDLYVAHKHRQHHRDPLNLAILLIPLRAVAGGLFVLPPLAFLLATTPAHALTFLSAYYVLSLHYEWVHFLVHTPYRPQSWFYKRLWRNHRLHHFKNEHYWYGVSMLAGDLLFRTQPAKDAVPTSPTCRTLGQEETLPARV